MRTVTLALAALMPFLPLANAAPIPPEILAQCEKEFGDDLKKQLGCVEELVDALTKFREEKKPGADAAGKKPDVDASGRTIGVTEKPAEEPEVVVEEEPSKGAEEETAVIEEPVKKPAGKKAKSDDENGVEPGEAVIELNFKTVGAYCESQLDNYGKPVDPLACEEEENGAGKNLEYASSKYEGDIPGDPLVACKKFVDAYQPLDNGYYSPRYPTLKCLQSKISTRVFADCFTRYTGLAYSPQVQSVPEESAGDVAVCFRKLILTEK